MARTNALRRVSRRRYWREDDARVVVDGWRTSGETLKAFCRRNGLKQGRVQRWSRRLESKTEQHPEELKFHPVDVVESHSRSAERDLEVELGGGETVRVAPGFALEDLRRVLAALDERYGC